MTSGRGTPAAMPAPDAPGPRPGRPREAFVLRTAGLPVETVRPLRAPGARRWADDVLDAAARLTADGEALGDLLHPLIGGLEDEAERRALLKLRREVFNNRLPKDPEAARALVAARDPRTAEALAGWLERRAALAVREAEGAGLLASETARARAALCAAAGQDRLRRGLLLASPTLDAGLDAYVRRTAADPAATPDKKHRKIERSLLSYLYRTACKTSPFSTFTGVGLGTFTDGEPHAGPGAFPLAVAAAWPTAARLNTAAVGRLAATVLADPGRRADLPVTVASGWGREADRVRYVRRWVTEGDEATAVTFDSVKDRLFYLRRSGTLDRLLGHFEEHGTLRYGALSAWLAADRDATEADVAQYLDALLALGLVRVPCLDVTVHDTDPLRAFQSALRGVGRPWADRLADRLEPAAACVDKFAAAEPDRRRLLLEQLRGELAAVQRSLGAEQHRVPQTVLYEDCAVPADGPTGLTLSADRWAEVAGEPLSRLERVLPAFDLTLPHRLTFKGFFTARFGRGGRCDDLVKLVHDFHEDFFDQYLSFTAQRPAFGPDGDPNPEENWLGLPELKSLDAARATFLAGMRERWGAHEGDGDLVLDDALLDATAAPLAPLAPAFAPMSHHVQLADRPEGPLAVLNRSYGGLSFPFSRFTHLFEGLDERLLAAGAQAAPPGAVLAEVTGGPVTSNLNLHARLTEYEIVGPGEAGTLEPEFRLGLDDLFLVHDEEQDRLVLRSARLEREVIPVYLGYLVPLALPELPRTLLLLSPTSMSPLNVWGGVPDRPPVDGVTHRPRVRHGSLVLARRSWGVDARDLPLRAPGTDEAAWFLGWHRFRRAHGLPARVYATVSDSGARGATGAKPSYLDLDSPLSLAAFEALLRTDKARAVFREALPDEDGLHAASPRGRHVTELAVETLPAPTPARTAP